MVTKQEILRCRATAYAIPEKLPTIALTVGLTLLRMDIDDDQTSTIAAVAAYLGWHPRRVRNAIRLANAVAVKYRLCKPLKRT